MIFERVAPIEELEGIVKEFWIYENEEIKAHSEKIIPDGYSEIIIHYGDPYRIKLEAEWEDQSSILFSSQISKFFYLENTGTSKMLGIKLHPTAFHELFQKDISAYTDRVIPLKTILSGDIEQLEQIRNPAIAVEERILIAQKWIQSRLPHRSSTKITNVVDEILLKKGLVDIEQLSNEIGISSRHLERSFKKVVGLTPKFYSRIIRFNYIFEVMKERKDSWIRTALQSGYFDQSHFIKNFKEFTGEEPSQYGFDKVNLANFFLKTEGF